MKKLEDKTVRTNDVAVENYEGVLSYICSNFDRSIRLTTFNFDKLTSIFGVHNTTFKGEFNYYVWIVEFEGDVFQIFTANGKGTCFTVVDPSFSYDTFLGPETQPNNKSKNCLKFLKEIDNKLKTK